MSHSIFGINTKLRSSAIAAILSLFSFASSHAQSISPMDKVEWFDLTTTERDTVLRQHIAGFDELRMLLKYPALDIIGLSRDSLLSLTSNAANNSALRDPQSVESGIYDSLGNLKYTYLIDGPDGLITMYDYDSVNKKRTRVTAFYKESNRTIWNHFMLYDVQGAAYAMRTTDSNAVTLDSLGVENGPFGILHARHFNRDHVLTDEASNEFDSKGRLLSVQRQNYTGAERSRIASYRTYDENGRLLTSLDSATIQGAGLIAERSHYYYDSKGRISHVDWSGKGEEKEQYTYGTEGIERDSLIRRDRVSDKTVSWTYKHDAEGHVIDEETWYDGKPFSRVIRAYVDGLRVWEINVSPYPKSTVLATVRQYKFTNTAKQ